MTNDGGPAFPFTAPGTDDDGNIITFPGMTLRDYFAGLAMQAMARDFAKQYCVGTHQNWITNAAEDSDDESYEVVADVAYTLADAMLAERGKK